LSLKDVGVIEFATTEVEWRPQLVSGRYALEVYLPEGYHKTHSARYLIGHTDGMATVVVDQSTHQGQWVSLGQYSFDTEGDNFLQLSNATGEAMSDLVVVFDAARWSYLGRVGPSD
jgi:hypothetical protein